MDKPEPVASLGRQVIEIFSSRLEQAVGSDDVGVDEGRRPCDGAVDMALGSEMDDRVRLVLCEHTVQSITITDVQLLEHVGSLSRDRRQRGKIGSISQLIDVDDLRTVLQHQPTAYG